MKNRINNFSDLRKEIQDILKLNTKDKLKTIFILSEAIGNDELRLSPQSANDILEYFAYEIDHYNPDEIGFYNDKDLKSKIDKLIQDLEKIRDIKVL